MLIIFRLLFVFCTGLIWYLPTTWVPFIFPCVWFFAYVCLDKPSFLRSAFIAIPASMMAFALVTGIELFIGAKESAIEIGLSSALRWGASLATAGYIIGGRLADDLVILSISRTRTLSYRSSLMTYFVCAIGIPFGWIEHQLPKQIQAKAFRNVRQQDIQLHVIGDIVDFLTDIIISMVERFESLQETITIKEN